MCYARGVRYTPEQREVLGDIEAGRKVAENMDQKREDERDRQYAKIRRARALGLTSGPVSRAAGISDTMVRRIWRGENESADEN